ncbi:helix-turn-helix transcriptional regulator [Shinella zoogloeoides]|uniref:helix-turn-helix transcriptional regulator n=1 Tax=Shinella zoogloeoides TaxID=352475 RepID=UPI00273D45D9|nr:AlpA family phage regulatory protein [Shinella zoogloeoides]WLR94213.1 AlpA family phage regulatory protein [Shinella zoogloeoides]
MSVSPEASPAPAGEPIETLLRLRDVMKVTTLGSTTIYRKMDAGEFPRPLNLGGNVVRWKMSDVQRWISALPIHHPE